MRLAENMHRYEGDVRKVDKRIKSTILFFDFFSAIKINVAEETEWSRSSSLLSEGMPTKEGAGTCLCVDLKNLGVEALGHLLELDLVGFG